MIARNLAEGRGFSSPFAKGDTPSAWFTPIVPTLWALVFRWLGVFSVESLRVVLVLQLLASAMACGCYAWISRALAGLRGWPVWCVVLISLLVSCSPESLLNLRRPWYFAFQELGVAAFFVLVICWHQRPKMSRAVVLGLCSGVTLLVNPIPVVVFGLILGWAWWTATPGAGQRKQILIAGLLIAAVISPWLIRNQVVFGKATFLRTNLGVELWQGNNPDATPKQTRKAHHPALDPAEWQLYKEMGEVEYSSYCARRAVAHMVAEPLQTIQRTLQRVYLFWCTDIFQQWSFDQQPDWSQRSWQSQQFVVARALLVNLPLLGLLILLGVGGFRELPYRWLFFALLLLLPLPYTITHVHEHYGYAVRPYVALLVLFGLIEIAQKRRTERQSAPLP